MGAIDEPMPSPGSTSSEHRLDAAPDAVVSLGPTGLIRSVNRQAEAMFGYAREELLGQPIDVLELAARRKDGSEVLVDLSLSSLDGVVVSAAVRDVTDRKRLAEERTQLEAIVLDAKRAEEVDSLLEGSALTPRELEVLGLVASGLVNKEIAQRLGLRVNTVRNHVQNVLSKLQAHSKLEAVATAVREGVMAYPGEDVRQ